MKIAALLLASLLLSMTACGGSGKSPEGSIEKTTATARDDTVFDESEIARHLGLTSPDDGITYTYTSEDGQECQLAVVLTSADDVQTYESAGDTVAANPDSTAGVKITDPEAKTCKTKITEALADFE